MQISGVLSTHLALQALFAQISPVHEPVLQAFPFPSTGKGDTVPMLSGLCVYLQFMLEVGLPHSPVQFSHLRFHKLSCSCLLCGAAAPAGRHVCVQFTWEVDLPSSHKLSCSWLLGTRPRSHQRLSGLPGSFIYSPRKDSLPSIFGAQCAPPSFQCVLFVLIAYYSVSLFFPGWRSVCQGGYAALAQACLWEYCVVPQSSPGPHLPKLSGRQQLAARGPSWFLCLT
jgi:hypothetical protein